MPILVLKEGLTPIKHLNNHDFRVRQKSKEVGDEGIYLRNYSPAKERAAITQRNNITYLFDSEIYQDNQQSTSRAIDKEKELSPPRRLFHLLFFLFLL